MNPPVCSFCGKKREVALVLIAGPACFICDACVDLAFDIVAEAREKRERSWVERVKAALDDLCVSLGDPARDAALGAVLDEPGGDERLRDAAQVARRILSELREIRAAVRAAAEAEVQKGTEGI